MSALNNPRRTAHGHLHVEAFCLMWYACQSCQHREQFWNSRDGVTPFGTTCPSCGASELMHTEFYRDSYMPNHTPAFGQRVWVDMTKERAESYAKKRLEALKAHRRVIPSEEEMIFQSLFESIYHDGQAPDMAVTGYKEVQP